MDLLHDVEQASSPASDGRPRPAVGTESDTAPWIDTRINAALAFSGDSHNGL
jgi:hypothetical protein